MTPSRVRLTNLVIEAFRGFRDEAEFDLDASTIIFTGPNGTGKTSVFDALQWVLLGSIDRLADLRAKKNVEHVVSTYRSGDRARVALSLRVNDTDVTVVRSGSRNESTLEVIGATASPIFGSQAEEWLGEALVPLQSGSLELALTTSGLLQQDVMRSVLEAKPADRYSHISAVLGLSELEEFEQLARDASKEANDRRKASDQDVLAATAQVERATSGLEILKQRALERASVEVAEAEVRRIVEDVPEGGGVALPAELTPELARQIAQSCRANVSTLKAVGVQAEDLKNQSQDVPAEPDPGEIARVADALKELSAELADARAGAVDAAQLLRSAEEASEEATRLAAAAIPLLAATCPVCGQTIDAAEVETRLLALTNDSSALLAHREALKVATRRVEEAERAERVAERDRSVMQQAVERWAAIRESADRLERLVAEAGPDSALRFSESVDIARIAAADVEYLTRAASALETYSDAVSDSRSTGPIDRASAELSGAEGILDEKRKAAETAGSRAARLKQLAEASAKARVDVTAKRFGAIEPLVSDIYSRLDPHPAFKVIGFEHDIYYGRGTSTPVVTDAVAGVKADPLIVFSASQANIAALSYFLAMSLGAGDRSLPFVLLDDPLQSMDDVNVLGFADLCRFLRSERQLILSTHDRRFSNLLQRKLAPRTAGDRTITYEFTGWDRRGPSISTESTNYEPRNSELRLLRPPA